MFLTRIEIQELTGRERYYAQLRWLRENRWPHETDADGRPLVARAYFEQRFGLAGHSRQTVTEPDWSALEA